MPKVKNIHNHIKVREACKKLNNAIDNNPDFFRGLKIPVETVANDRHSPWKNVSIAGIILAFFVKLMN
jgi:hypothetical protein